jgi:hypothetical protein
VAAVLAVIPEEVRTPLHPWTKKKPEGCQVGRHMLYVILTGFKDKNGNPYDRHHCWCGALMKVVPSA